MQSKNARPEQLALLLKRLAQKISKMDDEELTLFLQDEKSLNLKFKNSEQPQAEDVEPLIKELRSLKSKDAGFAVLRQRASTRAKLVTVAKSLDLPVSKRDTVEHLSERIVDATIGYRTRSAAIRGNDSAPE